APGAPSDWRGRLDRRRAAVPAASRRRCPPHRQIDPDLGAALGVPPRRGPDEALGTRGRGGMMSERVLVLDGRTIEALACVRSLGRAGHWVAVAGNLRWHLASWSRCCRARFHYREETLGGCAGL